MTEKKCPHCGAFLPEEAAFCPRCANVLTRRTLKKPPRHVPARLLRLLGFLCLAAALAAVLWSSLSPKTYEGTGEVTYADSDSSYQLISNVSTDRYYPMAEIPQIAGDQESYRFPLRLYINYRDTGADASGMFLQKVSSCELAIEQPETSLRPVTASQPVPADEFPGVAMVSYIDYSRDSVSPIELVWNLRMANGDTVRIRSTLTVTPTQTYYYNSENADLSDSQALQALIDQIAEEIDYRDAVNITLPAVTYTEPLILHGPSINLTGSESENGRTTFTAGIQMRDGASLISYLTGIDFKGDGTGVALSAAGRLWTKDCTFDGWKTALLVFGNVWANATDCAFTNNGIGIHYNSTDVSPSDSHFTGNIFTGNSTGVLLENVPATELTLNFGQCLFENNGTDLDNQCQQPVDVSEAQFR